ncbi:hypothetical protein RJ55_08629 [Drechmeria coniospora]|nr:hypothetical protein RJ55_08629 [Drechmeria coniospora]
MQFTTITTTGPTPGTFTLLPSGNCNGGCLTTIVVTNAASQPPNVVVTTTVPGIRAGTTTITPPAGCTRPCTTRVIVTIPLPSGTPAPCYLADSSNPSSPCPPGGLDVHYYANKLGNGYGCSVGEGAACNDPGPSYYINQLKPLASGQTNLTYFVQDTDVNFAGHAISNVGYNGWKYAIGYQRTVNGGLMVDGNNFTLVYEGYYRAPVTGSYQLCTDADNISNVYFGDGNAFACSDQQPAPGAPSLKVSATGGNYVNPKACGNVNLIANQFYPLRIVMGNYGWASAFGFTIQPPGQAAANAWPGNYYPKSC